MDKVLELKFGLNALKMEADEFIFVYVKKKLFLKHSFILDIFNYFQEFCEIWEECVEFDFSEHFHLSLDHIYLIQMIFCL